MFLSTLNSVVEKILSAAHSELAPTELAGAPARMPQSAPAQPALIREPVTQLAIAKEKTKERDPALRNGKPSESSADTTVSMLAPALTVASLQLPSGKNLAPDSGGAHASVTQPGASADRPAGDLPAVPGSDVQNIAVRASDPVAFRLQLITSSGLPVKETLTLASQTSASSNLSNQQTSAQCAGPSSALSLTGNPQAASSSAAVTGSEETPAGPIWGDPSQCEAPEAWPISSPAKPDLMLRSPVPGPVESSTAGPSASNSSALERSTATIGPSALESSATAVVPSPSSPRSSASESSASATGPGASAPGTSFVAQSASVSTLAASATLSRPARLSSGIWLSPSASAARTSDSRSPHIEDLTTSEIVSGPGQDSSARESTASKAAGAITVPWMLPASTELEGASDWPWGLVASPSSPLSESGMKLSGSPANGQPSSEPHSKAAAAENASLPPQSVPESQDAEPQRREPRDLAADEVAAELAQRKPAPANAFRQTGDAALQSTETITPRGVGDVRSDAAEPPSELPKTTDAQPGVDGVAPTAPTRQISLNLPDSGAANVAIQLRERSGRIEVAVRSGDSQLTKSLQSGLDDLVTRLENQGFKTQAWVPAAARQAAAGPSSSESPFSQQQRGHSGAGSGNQRRQDQGDSNPHRQPRPAAGFEESLADEDARMKQK